MNKLTQAIVLFNILIILNYFIFLSAQKNVENYDGSKLAYEILFQNNHQYQDFYENFLRIETVQGHIRTNSVRFLVSPAEEVEVLKYLKYNNIHFKKIINNVNDSIQNERIVNAEKFTISAMNTISFQSYQRFNVINNYMDYLKEQYPDRVKLVLLGESYEGRDLKAVLITNNTETKSTEKSLVLIDAGIHAREWIAPATALYAMQQLIENSSFYEQELSMYDWLIWPVVNPDGYEYTHDYDRQWRKNRQPSNVSDCVGTDLNRNFELYWSTSGASRNACSLIYSGDEAFSELESRALRDLLHSINTTCRMYLTLHSFGNYLLYPWGYTESLPPSWPYLDAVARAGSRAIKKASGSVYSVGGAANVLYPAAGGSDDYAFAVAKIPVVICMELSAGGNGFNPPADKIQSIVEESWVGIRAMTLEVNEYPLRNVAKVNVVHFIFMLSVVFVLKV